MRSYKKQIEEAEEIAALNLAKYRQVQASLASSQERADLTEQALAKSKTRAASLGPMVNISPYKSRNSDLSVSVRIRGIIHWKEKLQLA